eukprot:352861-Chlamydomonas_euryale.AAC.1
MTGYGLGGMSLGGADSATAAAQAGEGERAAATAHGAAAGGHEQRGSDGDEDAELLMLEDMRMVLSGGPGFEDGEHHGDSAYGQGGSGSSSAYDGGGGGSAYGGGGAYGGGSAYGSAAGLPYGSGPARGRSGPANAHTGTSAQPHAGESPEAEPRGSAHGHSGSSTKAASAAAAAAATAPAAAAAAAPTLAARLPAARGAPPGDARPYSVAVRLHFDLHPACAPQQQWHAQAGRCGGCRQPVAQPTSQAAERGGYLWGSRDGGGGSGGSGAAGARAQLCWYTGRLYCADCQQTHTAVIPAHVLRRCGAWCASS